MAVQPFSVSVVCDKCDRKRSYMSNEPDPGCSHCSRESKCRELEGRIECDKALELGREILEAVTELPSRASDFGDGVAERTRSIMETIESKGFVTKNQTTALENMRSGVFRWLR